VRSDIILIFLKETYKVKDPVINIFMRITEKDLSYMQEAHKIKERSTCPTTKVGCVIVLNNEIIATGYNDFPTDTDRKHLTEERPMYYLLDIHAEMRAIVHADKSIKGADVYVTTASCDNCFKHLIESGVSKVIYDNLFTKNKSTGSLDKLEAVIRLIKASGIQQYNMQGKTFEEDLKDNGIKISY
jgi:dCMP deaminase